MAGVVASRVRRKKEKETGREEEIRKNQLKVKVVEMWTYVLNHWCKFPLTLGVLAPMSVHARHSTQPTFDISCICKNFKYRVVQLGPWMKKSFCFVLQYNTEALVLVLQYYSGK